MKEIDLLKEVIRMAVKEAVREVLLTEMKGIKEDVKKIKTLTATILKEGREATPASVQPSNRSSSNYLSNSLAEEINGVKRFAPQTTPSVKNAPVTKIDQVKEHFDPAELAEAAMNAGLDDSVGLPEIDVPVSMFLGSQMYKNVLHEISKD